MRRTELRLPVLHQKLIACELEKHNYLVTLLCTLSVTSYEFAGRNGSSTHANCFLAVNESV